MPPAAPPRHCFWSRLTAFLTVFALLGTASLSAQTTYTLTAFDSSNYRVSGGGFSNALDPALILIEGQTYVFQNQANGHPLRLGTSGFGSSYNGPEVVYSGPQAHGAANFNGQITFTPNASTPRSLIYYCVLHPSMLGSIQIQAPVVAAPVITDFSASQPVTAGQSLVLTVTATSTVAPTYIWRRGPTVLGDQTGATLTIDHTTTAEAGSYTVTVQNSGGSATSEPAVVTVLAPPLVLTAEDTGDGSVRLRIPTSFPRLVYSFEAAESPAGPWSALATEIPGTGAALERLEPASPAARFFRAVVRY